MSRFLRKTAEEEKKVTVTGGQLMWRRDPKPRGVSGRLHSYGEHLGKGQGQIGEATRDAQCPLFLGARRKPPQVPQVPVTTLLARGGRHTTGAGPHGPQAS